MSEPQPPQRHLDATQGREVVYCHGCENEWYRDEQPRLECPRCHGEIIEIVSPESDPRNLDDGPDINFATRPSNRDRYHDSDSDPEEADIDQHVHHTPRGFLMQRTLRPGGPGANHNDDEMAVLRRFTDMINDFHGGPPRRDGPAAMFPQMPGDGRPDAPRGASPGPAFTRTTFRATPFGSATVTVSTIGGVPGGRGAPLDFDAVFGNLMGGPHVANDPNNPHARAGQAGGAVPVTASLHGLIALFLGQPPGGVHGDAVYSQEALDRIITQLMEQNPLGSNAAPPASEDAIAKLPKRNVTIEDLGSDGKAECTICIDELKVGDEVTVLPCKHWFHGECVTLWLKEHNTCPICRTPMEANANANRGNARRDQQQQQQQGQQGSQQPGGQQFPPSNQPPHNSDNRWSAWFGAPTQSFANEPPHQQGRSPFSQQFQNEANQDPAPSSSSTTTTRPSRYDRLVRSGEDRLNSIRNLASNSNNNNNNNSRAPPSQSFPPPNQHQPQQSGTTSSTSQRRSSHSPPASPENRTPRVRSPEFRSRDPFDEQQSQQSHRQMSGYEAGQRRGSERSSEGGRDGGDRRESSGPLNWLRDQFSRHSGGGGGNGSGGGNGGSGSGAEDKRRS